jgi:hypothetical protein
MNQRTDGRTDKADSSFRHPHNGEERVYVTCVSTVVLAYTPLLLYFAPRPGVGCRIRFGKRVYTWIQMLSWEFQ